MSSSESNNAQENKVSLWMRQRYFQYLSGRAFANNSLEDAFLKQLDDCDDGLEEQVSEDEVIDPEYEQKHGRYHRILLDVEQARVEREQQQRLEFEEKLKKIAAHFDQQFINAFVKQLSDYEMLYSKQLNMHACLVDLLVLSIKGHPKLTEFATALTANEDIGRRVIRLVQNSAFMEQTGREAREVKTIQPAAGLLGVELLRALIPALVFKHKIRMQSEHLPLCGKKLWRFILTTSQACSFILKQHRYRFPQQGMILGCMYSLGYLAVYHKFDLAYEELKYTQLSNARNEGNKLLHDLLFEVPCNSKVFELALDKSAFTISVESVKLAFPDSMPELVNAIEQQTIDLKFESKTLLAQALQQAIAYSQLEQLEKVSLVKSNLIPHYLKENNISETLYKQLNAQQLYKLDLTPYRI